MTDGIEYKAYQYYHHRDSTVALPCYQSVVMCFLPPVQGIPGALPSKTPVSLLQELCMRRGISPKYDLLQIEGAVHEPTFVYRVTVGEFAGVCVFCFVLCCSWWEEETNLGLKKIQKS